LHSEKNFLKWGVITYVKKTEYLYCSPSNRIIESHDGFLSRSKRNVIKTDITDEDPAMTAAKIGALLIVF